MKNIAILGSTGSIGTQTLEVADENPDICIKALAAGRNVDLMEKQVRKYHPCLVSMESEKEASDLRARIADTDTHVENGMDGLIDVSTFNDAEMLVTGIVGMIGIKPTIAAIKAHKTIALANKETLVTAGHIIMNLAKEEGVQILPVDSEHSAIFQSLQGFPRKRLSRIILTASGGAFRGMKRCDLEKIDVDDALKNPNWSMGKKVTADSASLINKGLEVMEARWLFGVGIDDIEVLVHPQSILHSAVEYEDGAVIGQLGVPDMKLPIQYALFYPDRRPMSGKKLELADIAGGLTFEKPDTETFTGFPLALKAGRMGGSMPTVFNAANEAAVKMFLGRRIGFLQIPELIKTCMDMHSLIENPTVDEILEAEKETHENAEQVVSRW